MHDIELFAIWFSSVFAGGILTMLMPRIFSEASGNQVSQDESEYISMHQRAHERADLMILIGEEA